MTTASKSHTGIGLLTLDENSLFAILNRLGPVSLACVCCCCKNLKNAARRDELWKPLCQLRWWNTNDHIRTVNSISQRHYHALYSESNGWRVPKFTSARLTEPSVNMGIEALTVCSGESMGLPSPGEYEQVAVTCKTLSDCSHWVDISTLPSQELSGRQIGAVEVLASVVCCVAGLSPGLIAVGGSHGSALYRLSTEESDKLSYAGRTPPPSRCASKLRFNILPAAYVLPGLISAS